jgi:hypothetical protein
MHDCDDFNWPHIAAVCDKKWIYPPEFIPLVENILPPMPQSRRVSKLRECSLNSAPHLVGGIESSGFGGVLPDIKQILPGLRENDVRVHDAFRLRRSALRRRNSAKTSSPL